MAPEPGDLAPDFTLDTDRGDQVHLADLRGTRVILYFYPADDTPGCTRQACAIRDQWSDVEETGAYVFGVSPDDVESHVAFRDKFSLPFPLLADPDRSVAEAYGVLNGPKLVRSTFLIDEDGRIARAWRRVDPDDHIQIILDALAA
jgi:thioredoxin-dependent peroxiredoxin